MTDLNQDWSSVDRPTRRAIWLALAVMVLPVLGVLLFLYARGFADRDWLTNLLYSAVLLLVPVSIALARLAATERFARVGRWTAPRAQRDGFASMLSYALFLAVMTVEPDRAYWTSALIYVGAVLLLMLIYLTM